MDKDFMAQNRQTYNAIAKHFSDTRSYVWDDLKPLSRFVKNGDEVLDVGCGNGRLIQLFFDTHVSYTGVDQSEELIAIAKEKYPDKNFTVAGMELLPFADESFDAVYCIAAFHHLPTDELRLQSLKEMKRVLKPDGLIIIMNWNLASAWAQNKVKKKDWKIGSSREHYIISWKNAKGEEMGERHYWSITVEAMECLSALAGLDVMEKFYTKRDAKSDKNLGENLVCVMQKSADMD